MIKCAWLHMAPSTTSSNCLRIAFIAVRLSPSLPTRACPNTPGREALLPPLWKFPRQQVWEDPGRLPEVHLCGLPQDLWRKGKACMVRKPFPQGSLVGVHSAYEHGCHPQGFGRGFGYQPYYCIPLEAQDPQCT